MAAVNAKQVYLVSGQRVVSESGKAPTLAPQVEQIVVVAPHDSAAYAMLSESTPLFRPLGHSTLFEHEQAARMLRATLQRKDNKLIMLVAPGMAE